MGLPQDEYSYVDLSAMSHEERVAPYHANIDDDPNELADIYLDFLHFDRSEFQVFKERLSIAVFITRSVDTSAAAVTSRCDDESATGSHRVPGWEGESDLLLENRRGLAGEAAEIGRGAATITAVAALESLLDDLLDLPAARWPPARPARATG